MYYCTMPVAYWGEAGDMCPYPPRRGCGECPKKSSRIYMYGNGLVVFGVFWGGLGVFRGCRFPKKKFSALYVR